LGYAGAGDEEVAILGTRFERGGADCRSEGTAVGGRAGLYLANLEELGKSIGVVKFDLKMLG
jgi:hypothetical protein